MAAHDSLDGEHTSIWLDTSPRTGYDALDGGLTVDTLVVGGGIVGVTTAFELLETGQSVALVERDRILEGVTGHTTAKLTSLHGLIYEHLIETFGEEQARQYAQANESAIDTVESLAGALDADCDFQRAPAYTYVEDDERRSKIRDEVNAARRLGLPASYTESTELPFDVSAAIRFDEQGLFHPRQYLLSLANSVVDTDGGHVFEETRATDVETGSPCRVDTDRGEIVADDVVVATHFPILDPSLYFARVSPKRSYVLAVELNGQEPEGMYYDPDEPYFSVRPVPSADEPTVLVGGQNHRTGEGGSTVDRYRKLRETATDRFDVAEITYRWSTQDYTSVDKVPFVGPIGPGIDNVYVATGFGGWGMTNGTAAGELLADLVRGRENAWADVYKPTRLKIDAGAKQFLEHNAHSTKHYAKKYLGMETSDVQAVSPGEGRVVDTDDGPVALSRDEDGELHAVSAVCSHMGCLVEWNDGERSWDCPCHGSRFDVDGSVLDTPAVEDLEPYDDTELRSLDTDFDTPRPQDD
jgi:glycine/D-amino acid oxidase-like deaminating enzyme/nitrite reductase/ring-hydroxylating ferredoxin subunit